MSNSIDREELVLNEESAKKLAAPFGRFDENGKYDPERVPAGDPLPNIVPSLLNSGDIKKYVEKTGLISPFYVGGGEKSRMKNASYEGRIGDSAYIFKPGETEPTKVFSKGDRILSVPANSIVFVESDLYFRVPEFIALRFNLQIKHVHRGLLLGTGPLIDPGYWGKLCIPLHNLTDEDYYIPADEGLIWIEFTKTTKIEERIGRPPLGKEFQEIRGFLEKASQLLDTPSKKVGIRSSIPSALVDSATSAEKAAESAQKAKVAIQRIGWGGIVAAVIALIALVIPLYQMNNTYSSDVLSGFKEVFSTTSSLESALNAERIARKKIEAEIRELKDGISKLCSILENKEQQRACLSIDIKP